MKLNKKYTGLSIVVCLTFVLIYFLSSTHADEIVDRTNEFNEFIVNSTTPEGVTINMFDYWVTDTEKPQYDMVLPKPVTQFPNQSIPSNLTSPFDTEQGINKNHLFLFRTAQDQAYGVWNANTRNYLITNSGLVQNTLDESGYPKLSLDKFMLESANEKSAYHIYPTTKSHPWPTWSNFAGETTAALFASFTDTEKNNWATVNLGKNAMIANKDGLATESLEYLFNPNYEHPGKISYTNVKGLFKSDGDGFYSYNCEDNYASLDYDINDVDPNKKVIDGAKISLYNKPLLLYDDGEKAQFFPFNKVSDFFEVSNGELKEKEGLSTTGTGAIENLNHYFGVEMKVPFLVPENGVLESVDDEGHVKTEQIKFEFKGDDDLWVFIDDVLVLDISGMHSGLPGYINFSTGEVYRKVSGAGWKDPMQDQYTTMKDQFIKAGKYNPEEWKQIKTEDVDGWILAPNTSHTMKVYYLERGHYASTINIKFNLQTQIPIDLKKIDRDEKGIEGVEFELYQAKGYKPIGDAANVMLEDVKDYIKPENIIATLTTDEFGQATFKEKNSTIEKLINFSEYYNNGNGTQIFILKEKNVPSNFQPLANEIVLRYDPNFSMLVVNNKFETGAYANFKSTIYGNNQISYSNLNVETGDIPYNLSAIVTDNEQASGLIIGVPLIENNGWYPIYGSNQKGFSIPDESYGDINNRILASILYQAIDEDTPNWYFKYNSKTKRLEATFDQMPGTADRYRLKSLENDDGDMQMAYGIINDIGLENLGIKGKSPEERYEALIMYLKQQVNDGKTTEEVVKETINKLNAVNNFSLVNIDRFSRNFSSTIYIPNDTRELKVNKIDEQENPVNGAVFSIYKTEEDANNNTNPIATGTTGTVKGQDGVLIFTPNVLSSEGYAYASWTGAEVGTRYYLKEVSAPEGYVLNKTIVPIVLGAHSIYADAGTSNDGISVKAGIGRLVKTMHRYAIDRNVDITLRDIKLIAQTQESNNFIVNDWHDSPGGETIELHTYPNTDATYTLHKGQEGSTYIEAETGFIRTRVIQNYNKHTDPSEYEYVPVLERKVDEDLTDIYRIVNIVVVRNKRQTRTISGIAFEDLNKDDLYTESEDTLLPNIKVSLINPINNSIIEETTTNDKGYYIFKNLNLDKYIVKFELKNGYIVIEKGIENNSNKANPDGKTDEIEFDSTLDSLLDIENINLGLRIVKFMFTKIDGNNRDAPIKNAGSFEFYEYICDIENEELYTSLVKDNPNCFKQIGQTTRTDENGIVEFSKLEATNYRLVESDAPDGFVRPSGEWNITFSSGNIKSIECIGGSEGGKCPAFINIKEEGKLYLPNLKAASIPNSGGIGRIIITSFGVTTMGVGLLILISDKKKISIILNRIKKRTIAK